MLVVLVCVDLVSELPNSMFVGEFVSGVSVGDKCIVHNVGTMRTL